MAKSGKDEAPARPVRPPATTPEARENQLIAAAMDLAERQIRDGTASSQVVTHFLKLASVREQLEREKLRGENIVLKAKAESMGTGARIEELTARALEAMRSYKGAELEMPDD